MLIVWGKKRVERNVGLVADFCPICREVRAFQLIRVGLAGHIYYVSFGEGKLAGHITRCGECGVVLGVDPTRYTKTEADSRVSLEVLLRDTFPNLRETYAKRLELETQLKRTRSSLPADEYKHFLMEPFVLLNSQVEARFANSTQMDKRSGVGCLATAVIGAVMFFGSLKFNGPKQDKILVTALIFVVIGTVYTFIQMHLGPGRFYRAKLLPPLVKALKPLAPTREDVAECVARCKTLGLKIGKVAKLDEIWSRLERSIAGFDS
jgi:hypothetical protein